MGLYNEDTDIKAILRREILEVISEYGLFTGVVKDIIDPQQKGRIKVNIFDLQLEVWCYFSDKRNYITPAVNSNVLVQKTLQGQWYCLGQAMSLNNNKPTAYQNQNTQVLFQDDNITIKHDKITNEYTITGQINIKFHAGSESAVLGNTLFNLLNTYYNVVSQIVPGTTVQNATALGQIKTAAINLLATLNTILSQKFFIE